MNDTADSDVDDSGPRRRPELPAAFDRLFAPVPSSSDLAAQHAERVRRLAERGGRLDRAALEQMRNAVAEPVDCALETLRPLTAKLGAMPVPADLMSGSSWAGSSIAPGAHGIRAAMLATSDPIGAIGDESAAGLTRRVRSWRSTCARLSTKPSTTP
jgi:hypothetical protein